VNFPNLSTIRFLSRIESIINNISESLLLTVRERLQNIARRLFNDDTHNNNTDTDLHAQVLLCVVCVSLTPTRTLLRIITCEGLYDGFYK